MVCTRPYQLGANLADVLVIVIGSHSADGCLAQLLVQGFLFCAVRGQLFLDAIPFLPQYGQALGISRSLLTGSTLDVAGGHSVGQFGGKVRVGGAGADRKLVAGSFSRHLNRRPQRSRPSASLALIVYPPGAVPQLVQGRGQHIGAAHVGHLLCDVGLVGVGVEGPARRASICCSTVGGAG